MYDPRMPHMAIAAPATCVARSIIIPPAQQETPPLRRGAEQFELRHHFIVQPVHRPEFVRDPRLHRRSESDSRDRQPTSYTDAMPTTRRRRISRRAVMVLAVVVLLPVLYVGAWLSYSRAAQDELMPYAVQSPLALLFRPAVAYADSEWPGALLLSTLWWRLNESPNGVLGSTDGIKIAPEHPDFRR